MTILKALKDRIRSMGGETNATNIADAIKDLPKGGSSELPPEVTNSVETHGMGWTDEDETVHQIDEKYIPSSGGSGAMIVNATLAGGGGIALDKTYEEISSALPNVAVNIEGTDDMQVQYILPYTCSITGDDVTTLYFSVSTMYQSHVGVVGYSEITINSSNEVEFKSANLEEAVL